MDRPTDIQTLFMTHYASLHRYAFTIVKDNDEAEDTVQAVFLRRLEKNVALHDLEHPRAYLYRSVYNLSINTIRKTELQEKHHATIRKETAYTSTGAAGKDDEDLLQLKQQIDKVLDQLPPQCREVFVQSRANQKKYAEIASEMGIAIKTVEAHMSKALKLIRQIIRVFVGIICLYSAMNWYT